MADLLDELQGATSKRIGSNVQALGGDLLDEAGIKSGNQSGLSKRFTSQQVTEERQRLFDEMNADMSGFEKFAVGAGRGLTSVARGVGLAEPEDPSSREAFGRLADDSMTATIGEIVGEAAPFLAAAPLMGAGLATAGGRALIPAAKGIGMKIAGASVLGATEGGVITRGRGGGANETATGAITGGVLAGTIEALLPVLGRMGRKVFTRLGRKPKGPLLTPEGSPTAELQRALDETGTSFQDLTAEAFAAVNKQGVDPAQAARAARMKAQAIPATAGDISQDFAQQTAEQRLISQAGAEAGEPLRQLKLEQSQAFKSRVMELVDSLGVPDEAGDSIKAALKGQKKLLQKEKNALYKEVANASPEIANTPLFTDTIADAMPDKKTVRRLSRLAPGPVDAANNLLVEFGIDKSDEAIEAFADEITPLSIGNFEDFRQALNQIERADTTGAVKVFTSPVKIALDAEAELVDVAVKNIGGIDPSVLDTLKQARQRVRQIKTEFSPQAITGRLIDVKRDGVSPVIEASKVTRELLKPSAPIEHLERTMKTLRSAGDKGRKGIKDLQASVVLNALDDALRAPSRKTSGIETIGGNQFSKSLSKFGDDKLKELFKGNDKALSRLLNLKQTALDISATSGAVPKGSAPVILDIAKRAGNLPGLAAVRDLAQFVVNAGADDRAVRKAISSRPAMVRVVSSLEQDFPALVSALGVAAVAPKVTAEDK